MQLLTVEEALKAAEECSQISLRCPICGFHKDGLQRLMNHLLFKHIGHSEKIHCSYCNDVFHDHDLAHRHIEKHKSTGITDASLTFSGPTPDNHASATKIVQLAVFRICMEKKAELLKNDESKTKPAETARPSTSKTENLKETPRRERSLMRPQGNVPDDRSCKKIPLESSSHLRDPRVRDTGPPRFSINGARPRQDIPPIPFAVSEKTNHIVKPRGPQTPLDTVANPTPDPSPKPPPPPSTPPPSEKRTDSAERKRKYNEAVESNFSEDDKRTPPPKYLPPMFPMMMMMHQPPPCMISSPSPGFIPEYRNFWNTPPPMPHPCGGHFHGSCPGPSGFGGNQVRGPPPGWSPNCGGADFRMQGLPHHQHQYNTPPDFLHIPPPPPPPPPPPIDSTPRAIRSKERPVRPSSNDSSMSISPPPVENLAPEESRKKKRHAEEKEKLRLELALKKIKKEEPQ